MAKGKDAFFIGWSNSVAPDLLRFLGGISLMLVLCLGLLAYGLSASADDPANGLLRMGERTAGGSPVRPDEWQGEQVFRGYLETNGYPLLHVAADEAYPRGRVLLLSGDGKRGPATNGVAGPVELRGGVLRRGSIEMLVVQDEVKSLSSAETQSQLQNFALPKVGLGRWRISGEICDGKCFSGGMSPGSGISHKACAVLCLYGEVPAVFVTLAPVDGRSFLVLAGPQGDSPYPHISDLIGIPVEMEGEVERVGNILVFRIDFTKMRRL